jgi:hypothetical protein
MAKKGTFQDQQERIDIYKAIASILNDYAFCGQADKGLCSQAGQHENNHLYVIYYANRLLEGFVDDDLGEFGAWFKPTQVEHEVFGLMDSTTHIKIERDENGFWHGFQYAERFYEKAREDYSLADDDCA